MIIITDDAIKHRNTDAPDSNVRQKMGWLKTPSPTAVAAVTDTLLKNERERVNVRGSNFEAQNFLY